VLAARNAQISHAGLSTIGPRIPAAAQKRGYDPKASQRDRRPNDEKEKIHAATSAVGLFE